MISWCHRGCICSILQMLMTPVVHWDFHSVDPCSCRPEAVACFDRSLRLCWVSRVSILWWFHCSDFCWDTEAKRRLNQNFTGLGSSQVFRLQVAFVDSHLTTTFDCLLGRHWVVVHSFSFEITLLVRRSDWADLQSSWRNCSHQVHSFSGYVV